MRSRFMWMAAVVAVALGPLMLTPSAHANSDNVSFERIHVLGGALSYFPTTCSDVLIPPAGECIDHMVTFGNDATVENGGQVPLHSSPWWIYMETSRLTFDGIHSDPVDLVTFRTGFAEIPEDAVEVDTAHLDSASLDEVSIPMDDGTVYHFQGAWRANGDRQHSGNDGPDLGLPVHYNDKCLTTNNHAHQEFRMAGDMTGTLNGQPVHSYTFVPDTGWIFGNAVWKFQTVEHGSCSP